jgi:non-canonical poly(A) RNA polymerase PAPD5/7
MEFFRWIDPALRAQKVSRFPDIGFDYLRQHQPPPDHKQAKISSAVSHLIRSLAASPTDVLVRQHIIDVLCSRITSALARLDQHFILAPSGSCLSGTFLPNADIDLALFSYPAPCNASRVMERIQEELKDFVPPGSFQAIPQASVPVLKFSVPPGIQIDLAIDELKGTLKARSIRKLFCTFPILLPAQLFLKCLLRTHQLDQPYSGGIASYTLQFMILAYLQYKGEPPFLIDFICGFCKFYGSQFNFTLTGIDLRGNGHFFPRLQKQKLSLESPRTMHIIDPLDPKNILGYNSFRMNEVQSVLKEMADIIENKNTAKLNEKFQAVLADLPARQSMLEEYMRKNDLEEPGVCD